MDRLFQYNRFGQVEEAAKEKEDKAITQDTKNPRNNSKFKKLSSKTTSHRNNKYKTLTAGPAYAELYPAEYGQQSLEAASPTTMATEKGPEEGPMATTTTSISSSTTAKSVELAIRKYQEWSNKFLTATSTTKTTTNTAPDANKQSTSSTSASSSSASSSSSSTSSSTVATLTTSGFSSGSSSTASSCGYHSQRQSSDTELLVTTATQRKPKVYDCMKDFLKRKLFHQPAEESTKHSEEEDVTSDYDEVDMLDSSYNADEEYETDTSCSSSPNTDESNDEPEIQGTSLLPTTALMLNCWTKTGQSAVTSPSSTSDEEDSDAGISDCCQLLSEKSPKRRSPLGQKRQQQQQQKHHEQMKKKKSFMSKQRYSITEDDELLDTTWYQPHLSNKAAAARLLYEAPGAFLLYRRTGNFELALRLQQSKVRNFAILCCGESYKFKGAKKQFSSLKALVTHHSVMAEHLPMTLTLPRPETPHQKQQQQLKLSLRCADDFDTFESLQILGILKRLQAEDWEFS